jgi:hypothetical protein
VIPQTPPPSTPRKKITHYALCRRLGDPRFGMDALGKKSLSPVRIKPRFLSCPFSSIGHAHNRPQGPKGVRGRLRPWIFLTFGTTRVLGHQPHAPAAFTPRGNPWYSFLEAELTPVHMVPSVATEKIPGVTPPGIDPETIQLVAQCLNHYTTPDPHSLA